MIKKCKIVLKTRHEILGCNLVMTIIILNNNYYKHLYVYIKSYECNVECTTNFENIPFSNLYSNSCFFK